MAINTGVTSYLTAVTAGNPVAGQPSGANPVSGALQTVSALAPVAGPIGGIVGAITGIFSGLIKGPTGHLSYDQVLPAASNWGYSLNPVLVAAFGPYDSWQQAVANKAKPLFAAAMQNNWGLGTSQNQAIYNFVTQPGANFGDLTGNFVIWVGTNVDKSSADSFAQYFNTLFAYIFLTAFQQAGYDTSKLTTVPAVTPSNTMVPGGAANTTPYGPNVPAASAPLIAGLSGSLGIIAALAIGGAIIYAVLKRKG